MIETYRRLGLSDKRGYLADYFVNLPVGCSVHAHVLITRRALKIRLFETYLGLELSASMLFSLFSK